MSDNPLKPLKLFPRNLTARAATVVRGNPVTARPESGVENCWPGLEFDQRNLEKVFFPGLVFEYHDERGTILREIDPKSPAARHYKKSDIAKGVYLAFAQGNVIERPKSPKPVQRVFSFAPPAAMENWRVVHDFEPGPVAVALCNAKIYNLVLANDYSIDEMTASFNTRKNRREGDFVLLFGNLVRYLTEDGVIDPALVPAGHLTRSMCSPWQYDFTDCGCFFWASNKPDMVASADQPLQILNFQRKDRSGDAARTPGDWIFKDGRSWDSTNALGHVDIINHFNNLKFVVAGRETDEFVPATAAKTPLLTRREIIERLHVLAGVEHALCVEYLYAYYSLRLPPGFGPRREPWDPPARPLEQSSDDARIFTAADEVLRVAIDEMRHFRWVNELLIDLGEHWVLDRAGIIGIDFPDQPGFNKPFELKPLTREQLDWFIAVEKASPNHADERTIDGMYTHILRSIEDGPEFSAEPAERDRLGQFVKMIIDEGVDHYHRFTRVKEALAGIPESTYLRVATGPTPAPAGSDERILQDTADAAYGTLLHALDFVFSQGTRQRGELLESARRGMYIVDDACRSLSERKFGAMFNIISPAPAAIAAEAAAAPDSAQAVGARLQPHLEQLRNTGSADLARLADRMQGKLGELRASLDAAKAASQRPA